MKLHLAGDKTIDADAFERDTLTALGMPKESVMRHRTPQFGHVFAGDGYSAGYYTAVAERLRKSVFSVGNTVDPAEGYRSFRGREAGINALIRKRGFPVPTSAPKKKSAK